MHGLKQCLNRNQEVAPTCYLWGGCSYLFSSCKAEALPYSLLFSIVDLRLLSNLCSSIINSQYSIITIPPSSLFHPFSVSHPTPYSICSTLFTHLSSLIATRRLLLPVIYVTPKWRKSFHVIRKTPSLTWCPEACGYKWRIKDEIASSVELA